MAERGFHGVLTTSVYNEILTPLDSHGKALAEGGPELLHRKAGKWTVLDLSKVPADPNDPLVRTMPAQYS